MISSAIILTCDSVMSFELLHPFDTNDRLHLHKAVYFNITTMSTIGYGDIYP